jgi:hypothetical protein
MPTDPRFEKKTGTIEIDGVEWVWIFTYVLDGFEAQVESVHLHFHERNNPASEVDSAGDYRTDGRIHA